VLALGATILIGSAALVLLAEWLRRLGAEGAPRPPISAA
jgi:hypothetical protein